MSTTASYNDFAIILTWPDATIRGDEQWMMFFKKIGIVKNLNFKVGHTGIVIINHHNGEMLFYDFGRYITPRGFGRARSKFSDPLLEIKTKAKISDSKIQNLEEIVAHFEELKPFMYGEGKLYFSIVEGINFEKAKQYGDDCVIQGTYPYGAVARNNNNCSRFITRMLLKSSRQFHFWHGLNLPETIKSSPISNIVNASTKRIVYSYLPQEGLKCFRMNRWQSLLFLIKQLGDNVKTKKANLLPTDQIIGAVKFKSKPINIPADATYLGGVSDGAWYIGHYDEDNELFTIKRFTSYGRLEYVVQGTASAPFNAQEPWTITYDSHLLFTHIDQNGVKIRIDHNAQLPMEGYQYEYIKERYA
ncbi:hypothetical protein G5B30_02755 [Sphingobacterium sp. SGG-5]|uniref:DUF6695 family protein n=1 Tax=Sphingobacterium sp. SGG-5 TaxID=2710881 RepID=UPI0013EB00AE|nr:DUF6695 family protein [Sphingobacterium sp. SGG-5]NGM60831.1 hypothetical protein [Sphingobacterium sp. SGG-5]